MCMIFKSFLKLSHCYQGRYLMFIYLRANKNNKYHLNWMGG